VAKKKTVFVCSECGASFPTWAGRCNACGSWGTIVEEKQTISKRGKSGSFSVADQVEVKPLTQANVEVSLERVKTGISTLDEALGGGIVLGQVILLSGEPGIGKSTLLLQVANALAKQGKKVLYITGEESSTQVYLRGERINAVDKNILILADTNLENVLNQIENTNPDFIILDSVQTIYSPELESSAGSVSQVKEVSARLTEIAKQKNIPVILIGQVTKEGNIAGPKVLEHIVDTVAHFEGERGNAYRVLKVLKNRFGSAGEIAVFSMTSKGLEEVKDPSSSFFLSEKPEGKSGSIIFPFTEGAKPVLVEIQALVSKTVYAVPQRKAQGIDLNKLAIITAIIEKELNIFLKDRDIFVNVVGGMQIKEPAVDLPLALAIVSSYLDKPVENISAFGELGLAGEVRAVYYTDLRVKECEKFNIDKIVVPASTDSKNKRLIKVKSLKEAVDKALK